MNSSILIELQLQLKPGVHDRNGVRTACGTPLSPVLERRASTYSKIRETNSYYSYNDEIVLIKYEIHETSRLANSKTIAVSVDEASRVTSLSVLSRRHLRFTKQTSCEPALTSVPLRRISAPTSHSISILSRAMTNPELRRQVINIYKGLILISAGL